MISLALLLGYLVKVVDLAEEHGLLLPKGVTLFLSAAYGWLIAFLMRSYPQITPVYLAVVCAVALSGKIDRQSHRLAMLSLALSILYYRIPAFDPLLFFLFLAASLADEFGNDLYDRGRVKMPVLSQILKHRLLLDLSAAAASFAYREPLLIISIVLFDLGYQLAPAFTSKTRRG